MPEQPANTIFHLEMREPTAFRPSPDRPGFKVRRVDPPDPDLNRRFYESVGASWAWTDRLVWSSADWQQHVDRNEVETFVGLSDGHEIGYFELEVQASGSVEIVYFGLLPACIGQGLGGPLLSAAVAQAWQLPATRRVWVHTCTHDHQHALENYRSRGFQLFKTEIEPLKGASARTIQPDDPTSGPPDTK